MERTLNECNAVVVAKTDEKESERERWIVCELKMKLKDVCTRVCMLSVFVCEGNVGGDVAVFPGRFMSGATA